SASPLGSRALRSPPPFQPRGCPAPIGRPAPQPLGQRPGGCSSPIQRIRCTPLLLVPPASPSLAVRRSPHLRTSPSLSARRSSHLRPTLRPPRAAPRTSGPLAHRKPPEAPPTPAPTG